MQFAELQSSVNGQSQISVPMLMLGNLNETEELKALVANAKAAKVLKAKKDESVQLLRATYHGDDFAEMRKVLELKMTQCKDAACIDHIIETSEIKTCKDHIRNSVNYSKQGGYCKLLDGSTSSVGYTVNARGEKVDIYRETPLRSEEEC